jgi:hypothetical protein
MPRSRILQEMHETARALHTAGVLSETTLRDFDHVCLSPVHAHIYQSDPDSVPSQVVPYREKVG